MSIDYGSLWPVRLAQFIKLALFGRDKCNFVWKHLSFFFIIFVDEKTAMRKEMEPCVHCEKHMKNVKYLDEQLRKCTVRLGEGKFY